MVRTSASGRPVTCRPGDRHDLQPGRGEQGRPLGVVGSLRSRVVARLALRAPRRWPGPVEQVDEEAPPADHDLGLDLWCRETGGGDAGTRLPLQPGAGRRPRDPVGSASTAARRPPPVTPDRRRRSSRAWSPATVVLRVRTATSTTSSRRRRSQPGGDVDDGPGGRGQQEAAVSAKVAPVERPRAVDDTVHTARGPGTVRHDQLDGALSDPMEAPPRPRRHVREGGTGTSLQQRGEQPSPPVDGSEGREGFGVRPAPVARRPGGVAACHR